MKIKFLSVILVLAIILGGTWFFKKKKASRVSYEPYVVKTGVLSEKVEATGEVSPLNRVEIKPPVGGRIEQLLVDEGDRVRQGQVLAWMSSSDRAAIIDAARAKGAEELKKWEDTYKPTPIIAPLSGVVILKNIVQGQTVDLSTILYALSDRLIVVSHVDEVDIGKIKMGLPVLISLDAFPKHPIQGRVFNILYEGKNVSNVITYGVKIEPKDPPEFFRSQMTANVQFELGKQENVILIPATAVAKSLDGKIQVMVSRGTEKPRSQEVKLGIQNGADVQVLEGLSEGETILIQKKSYRSQKEAPSSPLVMTGQRNRR